MNKDLKTLIEEAVKVYFSTNEEELKKPREKLWELSNKLKDMGYVTIFDKINNYFLIHGNNLESINNLLKEINTTIERKKFDVRTYTQYVDKLRFVHELNADTFLPPFPKDFLYEQKCLPYLKDKLYELESKGHLKILYDVNPDQGLEYKMKESKYPF